MRFKHLNPGQKYTCPTCNHHFVTRDNLKKHVHQQHLVTKIYTCMVCSQTFKDASNYRQHMDHLHVNPEPRYSCKVCLKMYKYKSDLTIHMKKKKLVTC